MMASGSEAGTGTPVLEIEGLSKSFLANRALDSFTLTLAPGEIHALVGANGSGKSTLIKTLSGFHSPDAGHVMVGGAPLEFGVADSGYRLGCRFVHQDLALVDTATVLDNLHLGTGFPSRFGTVLRRASQRSAREHLDRVGLTEVDPGQRVGELTPSQRTGVAVARALQPDSQYEPRLLVLDEPTATLPVEEVDRLLTILRAASSRGLAILYVTHHLDEVYRIGHTVSVLRDGRTVVRGATSELPREMLVSMLGGSDLAAEPVGAPQLMTDDSRSLVVSNLWDGPLRGVSLTVGPGEVVGVAGLSGSGRERLLGSIFGVYRRSDGVVSLGGLDVPSYRPDRAIALGIGHVPANRKTSGGFMELSAVQNISIADLQPFWKGLFLRRSAEAKEAQHWFEQLDVRPNDALSQKLERFSGGNQQKVLLAKWLRLNPSVLLLDEPTQGVDVGAKAEIHRHILDAARREAIVLMSSTDVEELLALCTKVVVLRKGRIFDVLQGERLTESEITRSFMSHDEEASMDGVHT
jgi:ribose transport system ATP-binding protein